MGLWRFQGHWTLAPARVTLCCFGPLFDNPVGDHLRVELSSEADLLPPSDLPGGMRAAESNLRSLLRLARELGAVLPLERRRVWTESGEDPARRLNPVVAEASE